MSDGQFPLFRAVGKMASKRKNSDGSDCANPAKKKKALHYCFDYTEEWPFIHKSRNGKDHLRKKCVVRVKC